MNDEETISLACAVFGIFPFLAGAALQFWPAWLSIPFVIVLAPLWLGALSVISEPLA